MNEFKANDVSRRQFLHAGAGIAAAAISTGGQTWAASEKSSAAAVASEATYFLPSLLRDGDQKYTAWMDSMAVRNGELFLAVPLLKVKKDPAGDYEPEGAMGFSIAKSPDGIHWQELENFVCRLEHGAPGFCMRWTGREFIIYVTENNPSSPEDHPLVVKQYRSVPSRVRTDVLDREGIWENWPILQKWEGNVR